jgi:hypothetical protein
MGWDVAIEGMLTLEDARAVTALKKRPFETGAHVSPGREVPHPFALAVHEPPKTVGAALAAITDVGFTAVARGGRLTFSGVWDEDAFRDRASILANVLAIAGRGGARGEVKLVCFDGPPLAFRLTASAEGVSIVQLSERAYAALANAPWVADVIERAARVLGTTPQAAPARVASNVRTPVDEALAILATLDPELLFACAGDLPPGVVVRQKGRPVDEAWVPPTVAYPDGASLRTALLAARQNSRSDDWRRAFALPALAKHDPARAEALALEVLASDAPDELVESAVHALRHSPTKAAIDALFAALPRSSGASFALAVNTHPSITTRAIAALDDESVRELYAPSRIPGSYLLTRAGRLVLLLQGKRDPAATSRLLEVWRARDRSSAAQLVGSALVAIGSPEGLREVSEVLGALDVSVARVAARAFLAIDRGDAFDRAQRFFTSDDPASQRAASALFGALPLETSMDPRWLAYAADVPESSPLHRAASWCLERVREVRERTAAGQGEGPHGST